MTIFLIVVVATVRRAELFSPIFCEEDVELERIGSAVMTHAWSPSVGHFIHTHTY